MNTKYAVINPFNGQNVMYDTKEEALNAFWELVMYTVRTHFHNTPYVKIDINEDGSETWYNDNNQELIKPLTLEETIELYNKTKRLTNLTPIEVLP